MTSPAKKTKAKSRQSVREAQLNRNRAAIRQVIEACGGTQMDVARRLGVTQAAVSKWLLRGWVSPSRARELEALTGISRMQLIDPRLADAIEPVQMDAV